MGNLLEFTTGGMLEFRERSFLFLVTAFVKTPFFIEIRVFLPGVVGWWGVQKTPHIGWVRAESLNFLPVGRLQNCI